MPDTLKFTLILAGLAGLIYGAAFVLSTNPPAQTEITKPLSNEKLRPR